MNWMAILNEIFTIGWLIALLVVLILMWRSSERRAKGTEKALQANADIQTKNAESMRIVAESVRMLAAVIQNQQASK